MSTSLFNADVTVTVPVSMPSSLLCHITHYAAAQGITRSALVRRAVLALVADQPTSVTEVPR